MRFSADCPCNTSTDRVSVYVVVYMCSQRCFVFSQVEKSVKLDESLIKVQQENEDLKARMDRHAALSR